MSNQDNLDRFKKFVFSKWPDELPAVDFQKLEDGTELSFDDDAQIQIKRLLGTYERDLEVWKRIPAKEISKRLESIIKACDALESILSVDSEWVGDLQNNPIELAIWYLTSPKLIGNTKPACTRCAHHHMADDGDVKDYLIEWRKNAESLLDQKGKAGRPENRALKDFIVSLHVIFIQSGGKKAGCYQDRITGEYRGQFLALVEILLSYTKAPLAKTQVAEYIIKTIN